MANQTEIIMLQEWMAKRYPKQDFQQNMKLGETPEWDTMGIMKCHLRKADIIFKRNDKLYLIEGKMKPYAAGIGQLLLYEYLLRTYHKVFLEGIETIYKILVCPVNDDDLKEVCLRNEIVLDVFAEFLER